MYDRRNNVPRFGYFNWALFWLKRRRWLFLYAVKTTLFNLDPTSEVMCPDLCCYVARCGQTSWPPLSAPCPSENISLSFTQYGKRGADKHIGLFSPLSVFTTRRFALTCAQTKCYVWEGRGRKNYVEIKWTKVQIFPPLLLTIYPPFSTQFFQLPNVE